MARSIRAAGGRPGMHHPHRLRIWAVHRRPRRPLRRRDASAARVVPMSGGMTERQVQLITDFEPDVIMVTPSLHAADSRRVPERAVSTRAASSLRDRHLRRRALDQCDARRRSRTGLRHARHRHLWTLRGDRPRRRQECVETKDGLHIWEDHFLPEVIDPATGARAARWRARRARIHLAHQRGDADHPLSHARPHAACCPARPARCGAWRRSPAAATT